MIRLAPYDPAWPRRYAGERDRLRAALGPPVPDLEHIGSTAVPGLGAKPILDIMAGVPDLGIAAEWIPSLASLGYRYLPDAERAIPDRRFFVRRRGGARIVHLHLVERPGPFWERHLRFRDLLRAQPATAAAYDRLKRALALRFAHDREAYTDGKTAFIEALLADAGAS